MTTEKWLSVFSLFVCGVGIGGALRSRWPVVGVQTFEPIAVVLGFASLAVYPILSLAGFESVAIGRTGSYAAFALVAAGAYFAYRKRREGNP